MSLVTGLLMTWKSDMIKIAPATTVVTKIPAPLVSKKEDRDL